MIIAICIILAVPLFAMVVRVIRSVMLRKELGRARDRSFRGEGSP